jgi:ribosome biogenesis GTPase
VASVESGEGIPELREFIDGESSVFVGQSGVGKSSLINVIEPGLLRKTAAVSEKFNRGKHTTTMAELLPLADGRTWIADTPGVRRLALRGIEPDALVAYFPELAGLDSSCAFGRSCSHRDEEGCAVKRAVEEGKVHPDRFESYVRIREELEGSFAYARAEGRRVKAKRPDNRRHEDFADE